MGRPRSPLIEKSAAIEKALEIVDRDGIDALSIRRLGTELGVNGASLYHHFADKEEILEGVRRLVLADIRVPASQDVAWQQWVMDSAKAFRAALLRHPNTAPLMIVSPERRFGLSVRDFSAQVLALGGVPIERIYPIIDSVETFAFGAAMLNPMQREPADRLGDRVHLHPSLSAAVEADSSTADDRFDLALTALVEGWTALIGGGGSSGRRMPAAASA